MREPRRVRHGEPGHLNVFVRDQDSEITGYGAHNRILPGLADADHITAREDVRHGLTASTDAQRRKVMMGYRRMHPAGSTLQHVSSIPYRSAQGEHIEHLYAIRHPRRRPQPPHSPRAPRALSTT